MNQEDLKIYEKIVYNPSRDDEEIEYDEQTENRHPCIPYYMLVLFKREYIPLPFFFSKRGWVLIGEIRLNEKTTHEKYQYLLPQWVIELCNHPNVVKNTQA